jgi:argininosuccinate lyase
MWHGRFQQQTTNLVKQYGESISYDWRLYPYDIQGSIAHAEALKKARILSPAEFTKIKSGLCSIEKQIADGKFEFQIDLEDIHMNIEAALTKKIGAAGAKLHTARSRNDQVSLDVRMYCRDAVSHISKSIRTLQKALLGAASKYKTAVLPGYTHLQRAQPVLFGHHLLAYVEMLDRDHARFQDALKRINVMPLGSGAIAGSTIPLDRELVAKKLGFPAISHNSMDAVSDRDFIAELLFDISLAGVHLSRLSEDVIIWCSAEFNYISLSDAHTTGSSLMPQKKNPDVAELTRGRTGRLTGNLVALLTTLKGLPMTYNRDLQEDKEPLFDSVDTLSNALAVFADMIKAMKVNTAVTREACADPYLLATDLADYLVLKEVPFRKAHEIVGKLTAHCLDSGKNYPDLSLAEFKKFSRAFDKDVHQVFNLDRALKARTTPGAPSPNNLAKELTRWRKSL